MIHFYLSWNDILILARLQKCSIYSSGISDKQKKKVIVTI